MAEIKIEKKKPVWPWILLGLIILGIILYFLLSDNDRVDDMDDDDNMEEVDTTYQTTGTGDRNTATWPDDETNRAPAATANNQSVDTYLSHVGNTSRMGVEHEYTNNALLHLINAVDYKAQEQNVNIQTDLTEIRNDARTITQNPQATNHANHIRNAATKIATAMEKIQKEKYPNLSEDIAEVRTAAQEIDTSAQTLNQKDKINAFFNEAADALKKMS